MPSPLALLLVCLAAYTLGELSRTDSVIVPKEAWPKYFTEVHRAPIGLSAYPVPACERRCNADKKCYVFMTVGKKCYLGSPSTQYLQNFKRIVPVEFALQLKMGIFWTTRLTKTGGFLSQNVGTVKRYVDMRPPSTFNQRALARAFPVQR